MLFLKPGVNRLERIQGAFLDDREVTTLVNEIKKGHKENYDENAIAWIEDAYHNQDHPKKDSHQDTDDASDDPKWDEALNIAQSQGHISASYLQRSLKIGYNRAARLVDAMFSQGLISAANGSKTRKWIGLNNSSDTL
jgi:S-DNA-T family DNA segregation ATPase FtsK/SpoIIIE